MFLASWGSVKKNTHMHQTPPPKKNKVNDLLTYWETMMNCGVSEFVPHYT